MYTQEGRCRKSLIKVYGLLFLCHIGKWRASRLTQRYFKPWKQVARNHHTAILSTKQTSGYDEGSIRHLSSWHIDPCRFPWGAGDYVCWAPNTPAQLRSLSNVINFQVDINIFYFHMLWIWIFFQEIFVVHDPKYSNIFGIATSFFNLSWLQSYDFILKTQRKREKSFGKSLDSRILKDKR